MKGWICLKTLCITRNKPSADHSHTLTTMSEAKLKSLKVAELKDILAKAAVSVPAKANKQDLIKLVSASPAALDVYAKQQNPNAAPSSTTATDDLVCDIMYTVTLAHYLFS